MDCWEFKNCSEDRKQDCPAYPGHGKNCWRVAETLCNGRKQGTFAQKLAFCMECEFYTKMKKTAL